MLSTAAAIAIIWAMALASPLSDSSLSAEAGEASGATPYEAVIAAEDAAEARSLAEAEAFLETEADWRLSARLYHAGGGGATGNDSLGCKPIAMRTVAIDPRLVPRRTRLFIRETVGMEMPDGQVHDGFWYASDTGGAIKGAKIDLYTGHGRASMNPAMPHNMRTLTVIDAGDFDGCPPDWAEQPGQMQMASRNS